MLCEPAPNISIRLYKTLMTPAACDIAWRIAVGNFDQATEQFKTDARMTAWVYFSQWCREVDSAQSTTVEYKKGENNGEKE